MSDQTLLKIQRIFSAHGGQLRMIDALAAGVSRYQLYRMRDLGQIEQISRGLYRLTNLPVTQHPDLVAVALKYPKAVLCLISALSWHEMTTQIPHQIHLAVSRQARLPKLDFPPVQGYRFADAAFKAGIDSIDVDGASLRIYSPEKTLADCFKFRNKIGMDVALEALKIYSKRRVTKPGEIMKYARICRVEKIMRPYLEAAF